MPSTKSLGAYEKLKGPVPSTYGDWSQRWEQSELRYVPPHRPSARIASEIGLERPSVRAMQVSMKALGEKAVSDARYNYRLPGFNVHRPELEGAITTNGAQQPPGFCSQTDWQTPKEAAALAMAQSLNQHSTASAADVTRSILSKPQPSLDLSNYLSNHSQAKQSFNLRPLSESIESRAVAADESYSDELPPPGASLMHEIVAGELRNLAPRADSGSVSGGGRKSVASDDGNASITSSAIYALEASGTGQVWVPNNRMPTKPFQRFATYPALAVDVRGGLKRRSGGLAIPAGASGWPLEAPLHAVEPNRSLKPRDREVKRNSIPTTHATGKPRVYQGVEGSTTYSHSGGMGLVTVSIPSAHHRGGGGGGSRGSSKGQRSGQTTPKAMTAKPSEEAGPSNGPAEAADDEVVPMTTEQLGVTVKSSAGPPQQKSSFAGAMGSYADERRKQMQGN